ncbi:MAG: glycosyltransferase family protein [Gammaproteobacteria bacterium]|nr:glycosyltransferase family protein [Gammaproteobacteria bacterium]
MSSRAVPGEEQRSRTVARVLASLRSGRLAEAIGLCDDLLGSDPHSFDALRLGASARLLAGRASEAVPLFERALKQKPRDAELLGNLGMALQDCGSIDKAVARLREAAALRADPDTLVNLACALRHSGALEEAAAVCERALTLDPRHAGAHYNRGNALCDQGAVRSAIACYEQALALAPGRQDILGSLANAVLLAGDFPRGWPMYEARFGRAAYRNWPALPSVMRRWDGRSRALEGKLLVVAEQGHGDTIQFLRYGRLLRQAGIHAALQCDPRIVRLLSSSDCFEEVVPFGSMPAGPVACWYPLLSLPLLLRTELETIPAGPAYLGTDPERRARWSALLAGERSFRVGIAWQGNPRTEVHHLRGRSIPLREFAPLAEIPGVTLHCLQKGAGLEQLEAAALGSRIVVAQPEIDSGTDAFLDTAALMTHLDLIVTSDTSIAHLAGALGRRVWVALQHVPDWRWLLDRSDSPWYPTMRLFRQPRRGAWGEVFEAMARELRDTTNIRGE